MNKNEAYKQQPRVAAPNPKGGKPLQNFATKMTDADIQQITRWIEAKTDIIHVINTLVRTRGITKPTAYRWYENVASMVGKAGIDNA